MQSSRQQKRFKPYRHTSSYYRIVKKIAGREKCIHTVHNDGSLAKNNEGDGESQCLQEESNTTNSDNGTPLCLDYNIFGDDEFHENNIPEEDLFDKINEEELNDKICLLDQLRMWALSHRVTLTAVTDLLTILRARGLTGIPKDGRTLLKTPPIIETSVMGSGKFWFNGIQNNLENYLGDVLTIPDSVSLKFNIDGISPFDSSSHQFWPILFIIDEFPEMQPLVAAIYHGESKPPLQMYFEKFVLELKEILNTGLIVKKQKVYVRIKCFICDRQARSFIKGTPGSNAENGSCIKCTVVGEWDKKGRHMSYPRIHCPRRTDESFRRQIDEDHHKSSTPLVELPIDMVDDFIIADSLHLFDLGIMRRCLYGWREGSYNFRTKLSKTQADMLSEMLEICNKIRPMDIQRAIRSLKSLKFWKGSEYRTFLLYLGPVVLKDFLPSEVYEHFLTLSCAVTILSCEEYIKYIDIAQILLQDYIEKFIEIYGIDSISSNVHNLCHVVEDVKKFGTLPGISSYPFENYLGHLKSLVRHGNLPLSQISKRIIELSILNTTKSKERRGIYVKNEMLKKEQELPECTHVYKQLHLAENFVLSVDNKNNYFMTKYGDIVLMLNATYHKDVIHVYGSRIEQKYDFFHKPFTSSQLNIFASKAVEKVSFGHTKYACKTATPKLYSLSEIKCKLYCVPYHDEFVFFPVLHTLDCKIKM